jgi:hypothetical protein
MQPVLEKTQFKTSLGRCGGFGLQLWVVKSYSGTLLWVRTKGCCEIVNSDKLVRIGSLTHF